MIFEDFCKNNTNYVLTYFKFKLSLDNLNIAYKLTENFFIDCFLGHQLQELLASKERKNAATDFQKDFQFMLQKAIIRTPLYNLMKNENAYPEVYDRDEYKKKQKHMRSNILKKCKNWFFSDLYCKNPKMCEKLAPIIAFILVDSYPFFQEKLENTNEKQKFDLYEHITNCIKGNYQEQYLFSIIGGSQSKKKDSIESGNKCLKNIINNSFEPTKKISSYRTIDERLFSELYNSKLPTIYGKAHIRFDDQPCPESYECLLLGTL